MNYNTISDDLKAALSIKQDDHNERKFERILNAKFPDKPFEVNVFIKTYKWTDLDEDAVVRDAENFLAYYDQKITCEGDIWERYLESHPGEIDSTSGDGEDCDEDA